MKVKVINSNGVALAVGKTYDVVEQKANGNFIVVDEEGNMKSFKASRFEVVQETQPIVAEAITYKSGEVLKDDEDNHYLIVSDDNFAGLVCMDDGVLVNGFFPVKNVLKITESELALIDPEYTFGNLTKTTGCCH